MNKHIFLIVILINLMVQAAQGKLSYLFSNTKSVSVIYNYCDEFVVVKV